eukprot:12165341-Alexandrium_andersonii.AAC.1
MCIRDRASSKAAVSGSTARHGAPAPSVLAGTDTSGGPLPLRRAGGKDDFLGPSNTVPMQAFSSPPGLPCLKAFAHLVADGDLREGPGTAGTALAC